MRSAELPENGPVRLGPVSLPAGKRVPAAEGAGPLVAWVTSADVPEPGPAWSALSSLREQTGLVPVLLDGQQDEASYFYGQPADVAEIDEYDAVAFLAARWAEYVWSQPPPGLPSLEDVALFAAAVRALRSTTTDPSAARAEMNRLSEIARRNAAPSPAQLGSTGHRDQVASFPGLAPRTEGQLSQAERHAALASLQPARIGLVPARRPADVPAVVGWSAFGVEPYDYPPVQVSSNAVWVAAVLRTFEDRFGAMLLHLDECAELHLLIDRPPRTLDHATTIAAELKVFGDEWGAGPGLQEVSEDAAALVGAPIWRFWWD